jgi:hypothetical protein
LGIKKAKIGPQSPKTEFKAQNQYDPVIYRLGIYFRGQKELKVRVLVNFKRKRQECLHVFYKKIPTAPTILERGLPICGLRPNHVCEVSR